MKKVAKIPNVFHRHQWQRIEQGHRPGGSDDDVEVFGESEACTVCGKVREKPPGEKKAA